MPGGLTARAIAAQPAWLRSSRVEDRLPEGARVLFAGYGTSFHAALAAGQAAHALDIALGDAGHLAAIDNSVRCFVLEGEGRAAERAAAAVRAR